MKIKSVLFLFLALLSGVYASAQCTSKWGYSSSTGIYSFMDSSTSSGSVIGWFWDFDDGSTSTAANPTHKFKGAGPFNVCLTIFDSSSRCTDTKCTTISPGGSRSGCDSTFSYYVLGDSLYYAYNFSSIGVKWDFGDGSSSTSIWGSHGYKKIGKYNVCMTVYCSSTDSAKMCVSINITAPCKASFIAALDTTKKFKLFLRNKSTNVSTNLYYWDFGDGGYSTLRNPTHRYKTFGKFLVCLSVVDSVTRCYDSFCDTIGLDSNGRLLKAEYWDLEVVDETVFGIKPVLKTDIKIYPNPANNKITIDLSNISVIYTKLEVVNANGQVCIHQDLNGSNGSIELNVETLNRGLYLIKLSNDQGHSFSKMLKN